MKKILLTLALAAFAFTANAQFVIGGTLGISHQGNYDKDYTGATFTAADNANTSYTIMPKFGYQLNDNMQVGIQLGATYSYTRNYAGADDTYNSNSDMTWNFEPYFRYNFASWKGFTLFAEAALGVAIHPKSTATAVVSGSATSVDGNDNWTRFGIDITPGLNYAFNESFSMDIYVDLFGLAWNMTSGDDWSAHEWGFKADMGAQPLLGYTTENVGPANIMTGLNGHLNLIRVGFNYHF